MTYDNNDALDDIRSLLQNDPDAKVCLSGGATGADSLWSQLAEKYANTDTIHFSFGGHTAYCKDARGFQLKITEERLKEADSALNTANKSVERNFPCRSWKVNSLLRRNYYQVIDSNSCYAVTRIIHGKVDGGTAWAVQMFIDKHMKNTPFASCPCWVYDMVTNQWFQWVYNCWQECDASIVPTPNGIWTGIGSRDLTPEAIKAMEKLWQRH